MVDENRMYQKISKKFLASITTLISSTGVFCNDIIGSILLYVLRVHLFTYKNLETSEFINITTTVKQNKTNKTKYAKNNSCTINIKYYCQATVATVDFYLDLKHFPLDFIINK